MVAYMFQILFSIRMDFLFFPNTRDVESAFEISHSSGFWVVSNATATSVHTVCYFVSGTNEIKRD